MSSVSWAWESGEGRIVDDAEMADDSPDPSLLPRWFWVKLSLVQTFTVIFRAKFHSYIQGVHD